MNQKIKRVIGKYSSVVTFLTRCMLALARAWFLKIALSVNVSMHVCVGVCVRPEAINN